ncbi:hypothetical protein IJ818_04615 [bacterium]|nr:hypothetical protein [bacterium]
MGTNAVSGQQTQNLELLLQKRKAAYTSAQMQIKSIQQELETIRGQETEARAELPKLTDEQATKIMILSNMKVKTEPIKPDEPKKVDAPQGDCPEVPKQGEASEEQIRAASLKKDAWVRQDRDYKEYNETTLPKYKADLRKYEEDKVEFAKFQALKAEIENDESLPKDVKANLDKLIKAAETTEEKLKALGDEYDFNYAEYQQLTQDMAQAKLDVTLREKGDASITGGGNDCLSKNVRDMVNQYGINGLDVSSIDLSKYENNGTIDTERLKEDLLALKGNATADIKKIGTTIESSLDRTNSYFRHMKAGDSETFRSTKAGEFGFDLNTSDDFGEDFGNKMNALLANAKPKPIEESSDAGQSTVVKSDVATNPNDKYKAGNNGEITLPRGMDIRVGVNNGSGEDGNGNGERAMSLESYGIVKGEDGQYYRAKKDPETGELVPRDNRAFSADEINKYFRTIENNVDSSYSKWLQRAQDLGAQVDIDAVIKGQADPTKALKTAVKKAETANKYATEIQQYGLNPDNYATASDLKAAIEAAKKQPQRKTAVQPDAVVAPLNPDRVSTTVEQITVSGSSVVNIDQTLVTSTSRKQNISVSSLPSGFQSVVNGYEASSGTSVFKFDGQRADTYLTWNKSADGTTFEIDIDGQKYKLSQDKTTLIPIQ